MTRERGITDALVDLFIATAHRIAARAERKVIEELVNALKRSPQGEPALRRGRRRIGASQCDGEPHDVLKR